MVNNLCLWCRNKYPDIQETKCADLCKGDKTYELLDFINDNLPKDLNNEINYKRKLINNIKDIDETNNFLANKRNYEIFINEEKKTTEELIYLIILLILAICFGLFCIYYYFLIK